MCGKSHGAIFDTKKAKLIHFTHCTKKTFIPDSMRFGDQLLQPESFVRWLGVWLDSKLKLEGHMEKIEVLGHQTIGQLKRINDCFSGSSPKGAENLVQAVLQSGVLFGSIVWLTQPNLKHATNIIQNLQNLAN